MKWNGHLEILSLSQVIENSRPYLLRVSEQIFYRKQSLGAPGKSSNTNIATKKKRKTSQFFYSVNDPKFVFHSFKAIFDTSFRTLRPFFISKWNHRVSSGDWLGKPANIKIGWKQQCCTLCWKLPNRAQFFVFVHKLWLNKLYSIGQ